MNRFESKPEIAEATERLLTYLRTLSRGDIAHYADMERVTGLKRSRPRFKYIVKKAWNQLLHGDTGIDMEAIPNVGYRLMPIPTQMTEVPIRRGQRRVNQHRREQVSLMGVVRVITDEKSQAQVKAEIERSQAAAREEKNNLARLKATRPYQSELPSLLKPKE